jgi:hypothetical protein
MKSLTAAASPALALFAFLLWQGANPAKAASVRLNEIVAANSSTLADEDGSYEDWIELYNAGTTTVDLSGWGLSSIPSQPFQWTIPEGVSMGAGEYLLIWASAKDRGSPVSLHTNFTISLRTAQVVLTDRQGATIDHLPPTLVPDDVSIGRTPSGGDVWFFFDQPTPRGPNLTTAYASVVEPVTFSHAGGFHNAAFNLALSHADPEAVILYTLDGSTPSIENLGGTTYQYKNVWPHRPGNPVGPFLERSFRTHTYAGPIAIVDRTGEPNGVSQISTTWHANPPYLPTGPVYKGTVVQARAYKPGSLPSYATGHTYFVDPAGNPYNHPIISLQIQEDLLFGYQKGVYTAGSDFETWRQNNPTANAAGTEHWQAPYNWQRGSVYQLAGAQPRDPAEWEYPARLELFEPDGEQAGINQGIGFRIHGNASRGLRSKSLRLYGRTRYDSVSEMRHQVFPQEVPFSANPQNDRFRRLLLRGPGSGGPFMHEWTVHKLMEGHFDGLTRVRHAVQFINGEYWGLTALRDRIDQHHIAYHYGLDPENVVITDSRGWNETHSVDVGEPADLSLFTAMRSFIVNQNMANETLYRQAEASLCMRTFIDHLIPNIYFGNTHFENGFWRARIPEEGEFGDGKFRVYAQDFEYSLSTSDYLATAVTSLGMFRNLLNNEEFKNRFINRFADLINTAFAPERVEAMVVGEYAKLAPDLAEHQQRWNLDYFLHAYPWEPNDSRYLRSLSDMIDYTRDQPARQRLRLRQRFGMPGEAELTLTVSDPARGHVRVNTMEIRETTPGVPADPYPWKGIYFRGIPIELQAYPEAGYRLAGWVAEASGTGPVVLRSDLGLGQVQIGTADRGERPFSDEEIVITALPQILAGKPTLRTANAEATWLAEGVAKPIPEIVWSYTDAVPERSPTGVPLAGANTALADGSGLFQPLVGTTSGGNEWSVRTAVGNSGTILQSLGGGTSGPANTRELRTTVRGLAPGAIYPVAATFWRSGNPWTIRAGLKYGNDLRENPLYDPSHPSVFEARNLPWASSVMTTEDNRVMLAAFLGNAIASAAGEIEVFVHDYPSNLSNLRTWYDGVAVGSEPVRRSGPYLAFEATKATTVYVVNQPSSPPAWLNAGFTPTGMTVATTAGPFAVWERTVSAGELVILPGKGGSFTDLNYWVILGEPAEEEFISTDPILSLTLSENVQVKAVFEPIPLSELPIAIHAWDFNHAATLLAPSFSIGSASLTLAPGPTTAAIADTGSNFETQHLRINNPLGSTITLALPTTGYHRIALEFLTRRSGQGAGLQTLAYTTDGQSWSELPSYAVLDAAPQLQSFDFEAIPGAADNPQFAVRIAFAEGEGSIAGNNRFDDVALWGTALPGTLLPPLVNQDAVPDRLVLIAGKPPTSLNLNTWFTHPNGAPLAYHVSFANGASIGHSIVGSTLTFSPSQAGGATVTVHADDGVNPPAKASFPALVYPAPFALAHGNFLFESWSPNQPAGSFPSNMLFLQSALSDPGLTAELPNAYHIPPDDAAQPADATFPYSAGSRTRINGLGPDGISFVNTGRGRDLGATLLALDTTGASEIDLQWTAGTVAPNAREYRLRLQYRIGHETDWADLPGMAPLEYTRSLEAGHQIVFGPVRLPAVLEGLSNVQLQWRYYHVPGATGARAELRFDDLRITSAAHRGETFRDWLILRFPHLPPETLDPLHDPLGEGVSLLLRYALDAYQPQGTAGPTLPTAETEDGVLVLRFKRSPAKQDIVYLVEASGDLVDWSEVLYDSSVDLHPNNDGDLMRVADSVAIGSNAERRFLRLRIVQLE